MGPGLGREQVILCINYVGVQSRFPRSGEGLAPGKLRRWGFGPAPGRPCRERDGPRAPDYRYLAAEGHREQEMGRAGLLVLGPARQSPPGSPPSPATLAVT